MDCRTRRINGQATQSEARDGCPIAAGILDGARSSSQEMTARHPAPNPPESPLAPADEPNRFRSTERLIELSGTLPSQVRRLTGTLPAQARSGRPGLGPKTCFEMSTVPCFDLSGFPRPGAKTCCEFSTFSASPHPRPTAVDGPSCRARPEGAHDRHRRTSRRRSPGDGRPGACRRHSASAFWRPTPPRVRPRHSPT
jgi:hypothetical protein